MGFLELLRPLLVVGRLPELVDPFGHRQPISRPLRLRSKGAFAFLNESTLDVFASIRYYLAINQTGLNHSFVGLPESQGRK